MIPLVVVSALAAAVPAAHAETRDVDDQFVAVAERVPGFGGAWVAEPGEDRVLKVWLTEPTMAGAEAAQSALIGEFGTHYADARVEPLQAEYSFIQLKEWRDRGVDVLALPGVVFTDIDERRNRLLVAVEDPDQHAPDVRAKLDQLDVPASAVLVEQAGPIRALGDGDESGRGSSRAAVGIAAFALGAAATLAIHRVRRRRGKQRCTTSA